MGKLIKGKHNIEAFMNSRKGDIVGACFARHLRPRKRNMHHNGVECVHGKFLHESCDACEQERRDE